MKGSRLAHPASRTHISRAVEQGLLSDYKVVLRQDFGEFRLESETRDLEGFYESVRLRARDIDNPEARQRY